MIMNSPFGVGERSLSGTGRIITSVAGSDMGLASSLFSYFSLLHQCSPRTN